MNEVQENIKALENQFVREILKAKTYFVAAAMRKILPPELYQLAKASKDQPRVIEYCKNQGYRWVEVPGETWLMKADTIIGKFRPALIGKGKDTHCEFFAAILGEQIHCVPLEDTVLATN